MADFFFNFDGFAPSPEGTRIYNEMVKLAQLEVGVGYREDSGEYEDGESVLDVATFNEFGTSAIPARPFMKQSFETHRDELDKACNTAFQLIYQGGSAEQAMNLIGAVAKGVIQDEIRDGDFVPNAPSTIRKKGSSRPLIDSSLMRQSVDYVVRETEK